MLRSAHGYYLPAKSDKYKQTTTIIIRKDDAATKVIVNYKLADKFKFLVGPSLTIQDITFNAIDSVIHPSYDTGSCLTQATNCCSV